MKLSKTNSQNIHKKHMGKIIAFLLVFIFISTNTQAQFLKKLKDKAKEKIEREAERRAQRRVDKKIDKVFDKTEEKMDEAEGKIGENKKNSKKNGSTNLANSYSFMWEYVLKMESSEIKKEGKGMGDMKIIYYLNPNSSTFASKFEMSGKNEVMGDMITIMDFETGVNVMLMDMNGQKILQKMPSINNQNIEEGIAEQELKNYTIVKTDSKVILGYNCQGFKIISDDGVINVYMAKDTPISFNSTLSSNSKFQPKGFNTTWLKEFEDGLMMEMQFTSSKNKKHNIKMTCTSLEKNQFTINISDYKSFGF